MPANDGQEGQKIQENDEHDFSIELNSNMHLTRFSSSSNGASGGVLIEGTLGKLQHASFVEPEILEVKGCFGVLRLNVRKSEITVIETGKKRVGGEIE
jgi:hypothetical protein